MQGLLVFKSLAEAQARGFIIVDQTKDGFLVRKLMPQGWALALVQPSNNEAA